MYKELLGYAFAVGWCHLRRKQEAKPIANDYLQGNPSGITEQ
jgi:hypothetical protein